MDTSTATLLLAITHGLVFVSLFIVWYFAGRKSTPFTFKPLAKAKSIREQRLVLEAISACAVERDVALVVKAIGKHAAEMTGFANWIIWLTDDDLSFNIVDHELDIDPETLELINTKGDLSFYSWIKQNAASISLGKRVADIAATREMRSLLAVVGRGRLIPFLDGDRVIGFVIVGGRKLMDEKRSDPFLNLFGAFAAIMIKKSLIDQREDEIRQLQQRSERLASLGKLAAGLAHEIRNPLAFIKAATQQLNKAYRYQPRDIELASEILEETDRINKHIEDLLALGKIDQGQFTEVDISEILRKAVRLAESVAEEQNIVLSLELQHDGLSVYGSEPMLRQLFFNLLVNAIQAIDRNGKIEIRSQISKRQILIDIEDDGPGIDRAVAESIFDPFFTTKESGTGLGLTIAYNVCQAHNGELELVGTGKQGTCFRARLPQK